MKQTLLYILFFMLPFSSNATSAANEVLMPIDALEQQNRMNLLIDLALVETAIFSIEQAQFVNEYFALDKSQIAFSIPMTIGRNAVIAAGAYSLDASIRKIAREKVQWFLEYDILKKLQTAKTLELDKARHALQELSKIYKDILKTRGHVIEAHAAQLAGINQLLQTKLSSRPDKIVRAWSTTKKALRFTSKTSLVVGSVVLLAATYEEVVVLYMGVEVVNEKLLSLREDRARLEAALYPEQ